MFSFYISKPLKSSSCVRPKICMFGQTLSLVANIARNALNSLSAYTS